VGGERKTVRDDEGNVREQEREESWKEEDNGKTPRARIPLITTTATTTQTPSTGTIATTKPTRDLGHLPNLPTTSLPLPLRDPSKGLMARLVSSDSPEQPQQSLRL
jgi:hypothetical protein